MTHSSSSDGNYDEYEQEIRKKKRKIKKENNDKQMAANVLPFMNLMVIVFRYIHVACYYLVIYTYGMLFSHIYVYYLVICMYII